MTKGQAPIDTQSACPPDAPFFVSVRGGAAVITPLHQQAADWLNDNADLPPDAPPSVNSPTLVDSRYHMDILRAYYGIED